MNLLGNVGIDTGGPYQLNKVGIIKTFRTGLIASGGMLVAFLITSLPTLDLISNTELDTLLIAAIIIPALEAVRRWLTDYSSNDAAIRTP